MNTISNVCENLFTTTNLAKLEHKPLRAVRRNLARIVYRRGRRPGLIAPQADVPEPPANLSKHRERVLKPMRHVFKQYEPPAPKRVLGPCPKFASHA